jgi:uncharacterized repeat protein (TIGR03803 family)
MGDVMMQGQGRFSVLACCVSAFSVSAKPAPGFLVAGIAAALFLGGLSQPSQSQTFKVIHSFTAKGDDGGSPYGGPVLDHKGNLYGTTYTGGLYGAGSVYELSPNGSGWKYTSLHSFAGGADGDGPGFGTLARHNGRLFGTTEGGANFGAAFRVGPCKTVCAEKIMRSFGTGTDGAEPIGGVVFDEAGNFYGTTLLGGATGNGAVYEVTPSGESVIYSFAGGDDATNVVAAPTLDSHGNLYGTSSFGGTNGVGAVYELSPSESGWTETILYNFQGLSDGQNPVGGVILDEAGNIYGGTFDGGINGGGTVYELSPSGGTWTINILYSFVGGYGGPYNKLAFDTKGNLYGATEGEGANGLGLVFKLTPSNGNWEFTDLYDFPGGNKGGQPYGGVAVDKQGNIFGTADLGGKDNQGVVFEITP